MGEPPAGAARPLVTLTANLLAEFTVDCGAWSDGGTFRARSESFQVGGKGINVVRMARRFGRRSVAIHFAGGHLGALCREALEREAIEAVAVPVAEPTRPGWVVRGEGRVETTFLGRDRPVGIDDWRAAWRAVTGIVAASGVAWDVALCGSVPGWSSGHLDVFGRAFDELKAAGCTLIADTYGPPLRDLCGLPLDLVKINAAEFCGLRAALGRPAGDPLRAEDLAPPPDLPVAEWVVTCGAGPVWYRTRAGEVGCRMPPAVAVVSPTGSGDVLLAALLEFRARGASLPDAVGRALPYAAANAADPGVAAFPMF